MNESLFRAACQYAIKLLAQQDRSASQLAEKLKAKEYSPETIQQTLEFLEEKKFLDDKRFVAFVTRDKVSGYGKKYWEKTLTQKGVAKPVLEDFLSSFSSAEERKNAVKLINSQFGKAVEMSERQKAQAAGLLNRRGFAEEIIEDIIGGWTGNHEDR